MLRRICLPVVIAVISGCGGHPPADSADAAADARPALSLVEDWARVVDLGPNVQAMPYAGGLALFSDGDAVIVDRDGTEQVREHVYAGASVPRLVTSLAGGELVFIDRGPQSSDLVMVDAALQPVTEVTLPAGESYSYYAIAADGDRVRVFDSSYPDQRIHTVTVAGELTTTTTGDVMRSPTPQAYVTPSGGLALCGGSNALPLQMLRYPRVEADPVLLDPHRADYCRPMRVGDRFVAMWQRKPTVLSEPEGLYAAVVGEEAASLVHAAVALPRPIVDRVHGVASLGSLAVAVVNDDASSAIVVWPYDPRRGEWLEPVPLELGAGGLRVVAVVGSGTALYVVASDDLFRLRVLKLHFE